MDQLDSEDWSGFSGGDNRAIARIYQRHKDKLLSYCVYVTGDRQIGEDAVQETFLRLMRQRGRLEIKTSLRNWLFICARNLIFNLLKERRETSDGAYVPVEEAEVEVRLFIEGVLSQLSAEERELILLREQQQFSIRELAEMLGLSEEAVRVRLFRIRKKMQSLVQRKR